MSALLVFKWLGTSEFLTRYMPPTTKCLADSQPVMMMKGKPVEGINSYRFVMGGWFDNTHYKKNNPFLGLAC